jgi:hypothetical protein
VVYLRRTARVGCEGGSRQNRCVEIAGRDSVQACCVGGKQSTYIDLFALLCCAFDKHTYIYL